MSNLLDGIKVKGQCFISNYKPEETANRSKNQINIWCNNSNKMESSGYITDTNLKNPSATKNYNELLKYIASLSGETDTLEYSDIKALKDGIPKEVRKEFGLGQGLYIDAENHMGTSGSARITFADGRQLRIDFKLDHEKNDPNSAARKEQIKKNEFDVLYGKQFEKINKLIKSAKFNECFDVQQITRNGKFTGTIRLVLKKDLKGINIRNIANLRDGAISDDKRNAKLLNERPKSNFGVCKGENDLIKFKAGDMVYVGIMDFK